MSRSHSPNSLGSMPNRLPRSISSRTPSPHPHNVPTRAPSPHPPYTFSRPPSPHPYILTSAPSPYPPTIPDHKPSRYSFTDTFSRHLLCSTPNPRPPYYPTTTVVMVNPLNQVSDGTPVRPQTSGFDEMEISIQEDFGGIEMGHHRADLIRHLDHVLERLHRGLRYLRQHNPAFDKGHLWIMKDTYRKLRKTLLRVDAEAEVLERVAGSHTTFMCALPLPCP